MTTAGPASRVLAAFSEGATSLPDVAATTGLPVATVRAVVEQLVRMGRMDARALAGCSGGGCAGCAARGIDPTACGVLDASLGGRGRPVLVELRVRR